MRSAGLTTVVDISYLCNASCRYCRWGDENNKADGILPLEDVLIPTETLAALGTRRVVLSGGEPLLHPQLKQILLYYGRNVDQVVVLTNCYLLDGQKALRALSWGATGFTVSLDSVRPSEAAWTRSTPPALLNRVKANLQSIADLPRPFELDINATVTHVTANRHSVKALLEFAAELGIDTVKFQPVFDDGYAGRNCPELLLADRDVPGLLEVAQLVGDVTLPRTNPSGFWTDVAQLASGGELDPKACQLGDRQSILVDGRLSVCYWADSVYTQTPSIPLGRDVVRGTRIRFKHIRETCAVASHCFCNQSLSHQWNKRSP